MEVGRFWNIGADKGLVFWVFMKSLGVDRWTWRIAVHVVV